MRTAVLAVASLSLFGLAGCAAVFRDSKATVHVESTPSGADAKRGDVKIGNTPGDFEVDRAKSTQLTIVKQGYEDAPVPVKKNINPAWLVLDIATCVFPVALCIPLLVDAVTGAWNDVDGHYTATLKPGTSSASAAASASASGAASVASAAPSGPPPDMSESERKATARAAYMEGVKLQEGGNCPEALGRLETAQKFYPAPTHLLRIAQCQAATGKLVESSETYETLVRTSLAKDAPDAFKTAQDTGKRELTSIRPRIPTLRIQVVPAPSSLSSLVVKLNGNAIPSEVLGIARPVNPGVYKISIWAAGYREANADVEVGEASSRVAEMKLQK
jgi:hypothetical protein